MNRHAPVSSPKVRDRELEARGALQARIGDEPKGSPVAPGLKHPVKHGKLWLALKRNRVKAPGKVLAASRSHKLPVALLVAVLQQETGIPQQNIFGCDCSATPCFCHQRVKNSRVSKLLASSYSNGVGWTQLTWKPFVQEAMHRRGGAEKPRNQLHVGAEILRDDINAGGSIWGGLERYNGSAAYANEVLARYHDWHRRLN